MKWFEKTRKGAWLLVVVIAMMGNSGQADFIFGEPTPLPAPFNSSSNATGASISADGLELYYSDTGTIWIATRANKGEDWSNATHTELSTGKTPIISFDGLELYFKDDMPTNIYRVQRESLNTNWGPVERMDILNSDDWDDVRSISADGLVMHYGPQKRARMATRNTMESDWVPSETPVLSVREWGMALAPSGLHAVVGTEGGVLSFVTRPALNAEWSDPVTLEAPVNSGIFDRIPWISYDGSTLLLLSGRDGGLGWLDLWQVPISPIVDFNGDGNVDVGDASLLIDNWGTANSLCDIGPTPFGDGIVDARDLQVLADYMVENPDDPGPPIDAEAITATASNSDSDNTGPEKTIDGSGLNAQGQHSTEGKDMWLSGGTEPQWIQYEFNEVYELHEMRVWNSNQLIESFLGLGVKDVLIETSVDGTQWIELEGVSQFNQATGSADYTANTIVDFGGIAATFVRINIYSGYGMFTQWGLSEVQFR
jgi:hypothetical protein